jgi:hypothetical protein
VLYAYSVETFFREVLSVIVFQYLTSTPASGYALYRSTSVLFQLIFEWHLLEKLPRAGFLPWQVKQSTKKWAKLTKVRIYRMVQKANINVTVNCGVPISR